MSRRTFLVTGATGDTGGATVEQMLARGHHVRALAHRQDDRAKRLQGLGAEVVFGDFLNLDDVRAALRGVAGAYFCYPIRPGIIQATAFFAQAAKEAGVECVVNMSQISAREDAKSHAAQDHWLAERVFDWSGLTVVHLRPTYFAEWLLYLAPMIRAGLLSTCRSAPAVMHQLPLRTRPALSWGFWKTPVRTAARLTRCTVRSSSPTRGSPMFSAACWE